MQSPQIRPEVTISHPSSIRLYVAVVLIYLHVLPVDECKYLLLTAADIYSSWLTSPDLYPTYLPSLSKLLTNKYNTIKYFVASFIFFFYFIFKLLYIYNYILLTLLASNPLQLSYNRKNTFWYLKLMVCRLLEAAMSLVIIELRHFCISNQFRIDGMNVL